MVEIFTSAVQRRYLANFDTVGSLKEADVYN